MKSLPSVRRADRWVLFFVAVAGAMLATGVDASPLGEIALRYFDPDILARGKAYRHFFYLLFFVQSGLTLLALGWFAARPPVRLGRRFLAAFGGSTAATRAALLSMLVASLALLRLPFSVARYHHAHTYGLRHDTLGAFLLDWSKGTLLHWILVLILGTILLGLFGARRRTWWLAAGALVGALGAAYAFLAPMVIDPLFTPMHRLPPSDLTSEILRLSRRGGVPVGEVWVAAASRRTRAVNAYFTGFGPSRRIVLYDTLLATMTPAEVRMVVAHEIGHWSRHHLVRGLVLATLGTWVGLGLLHAATTRRRPGTGPRSLGLGRRDPLLVFPAYAIYATAVLATLPLVNGISRTMEAEADRTALSLTRDPDTFVRTKVKMSRTNLSDVAPPRWIELVLFTHPATARRLAMAEAFR